MAGERDDEKKGEDEATGTGGASENRSETPHKVAFVMSEHGTFGVVESEKPAVAEDIASGILKRLGNVGAELCEPIRSAVADRDHARAAGALKHALANGVLTVLRLPPWLLDALASIEVDGLAPDLELKTLAVRFDLAMSSRRFDLADHDARQILESERIQLTDEQRAAFLVGAANAAAGLGKKDLAFLRFRSALASTGLTAKTRALAHHGIAKALGEDATAVNHIRLSADAFLEAGQRTRASRSLVWLARRTHVLDPEGALSLLDRASDLVPNDGTPLSRALLGDVHRKRASLLFQRRRLDEARESVEKALALERGLIGEDARGNLVASLIQASDIARALGDRAEHERLEAELTAVHRASPDPNRELRELAGRAFDLSEDEASALLNRLKQADVSDILGGFYSVRALALAKTNLERAIECLEEARALFQRALPRREDDDETIASAFACVYEEAGRIDEACAWHRRVLALNPLNHTSRQNLAAHLQGRKKWGELATFLEGERARFGDLPILLGALGEAYLELGRADDALVLLVHARKKNRESDKLDTLIARASGMGATVKGALRPEPPDPITVEEFERALDDFAAHVANAQRMSFWQPTGKRKHTWKSGSERHGGCLLRAFLSGRFREGLEDFVEVSVGSGRIDLLVLLRGGPRVIVELKLCGAPNTANYARGGLDQLRHYMATKNTALGYLLIFDGRVRDFGQGFKPTELCDEGTIFVRLVDVRPVIPKSDSAG